MRVLFPTGTQSAAVLERELQTSEGFDWEVIAIGDVASFLTKAQLKTLINEHPADCVVVSGMCTADFSSVEHETGIPIYRGTRHAADIRRCFPQIAAGTLSRVQAADILLEDRIREETAARLEQNEEKAHGYCTLRNIKFGGTSRIKVLCEIMDAHRRTDLRERACRALAEGADGIDLGFGFDAEPADVIRCFQELESLPCVLSIDTLNPALIKASLFRADIIISLTYDTLDELTEDIRASQTAVVLIPRDDHPLPETIAKAQGLGLDVLFADSLLQPPLSGMTATLAEFLQEYGIPKFMGCVNVT
ncbi:MAG TPA: dihydropteroate synthase, partial [Methanocorpusculum sp.]|nr:dihydropteroate synthase [Methanocorpusculum sp.]